MDRIKKAFEKGKAFAAFITGGDPDIGTTEALIPKMAEAGADIIQIGIPFSDPVAEGAAIQQADERALKAETTTDKLFAMVERIRTKTQAPLIFVTYMNPIYTYGTQRFMKNCAKAGVDGVAVLDVPFEEREEIQDDCKKAGIAMISTVVPESGERIEKIAKEAQGYLYCAASSSQAMSEVVKRVRQVSDIPCVVGTGIVTQEQARAAAEAADGAAVASAIVKLMAEHAEECVQPVCEYVKEMKAALRIDLSDI